MTLKELLIGILEGYEEENLLEKKLAYFVKDNPDGTFDAITIESVGISDEYILLANKCPNCKS